MFGGHYEHVSQKFAIDFFHHKKNWKTKKLTPSYLWQANNVLFQYETHSRVGPMSKKSYVQFLMKLMANGVVVRPITMV
jgi:hypothetical protein